MIGIGRKNNLKIIKNELDIIVRKLVGDNFQSVPRTCEPGVTDYIVVLVFNGR